MTEWKGSAQSLADNLKNYRDIDQEVQIQVSFPTVNGGKVIVEAKHSMKQNATNHALQMQHSKAEFERENLRTVHSEILKYRVLFKLSRVSTKSTNRYDVCVTKLEAIFVCNLKRKGRYYD